MCGGGRVSGTAIIKHPFTHQESSPEKRGIPKWLVGQALQFCVQLLSLALNVQPKEVKGQISLSR